MAAKMHMSLSAAVHRLWQVDHHWLSAPRAGMYPKAQLATTNIELVELHETVKC